MTLTNIVAQVFGLIGLLIVVYAFQCKENKKFFILQSAGCLMFFVNFIMIGAYAGAFFNLTNVIRGVLFAKNGKKLWKLMVTELLYTACFAFSVYLVWGDAFKIFISAIPFVALLLLTVAMYKEDGDLFRLYHLILASPAWILHDIFNLSLGGIISEAINMVSISVYFIRNRQKR